MSLYQIDKLYCNERNMADGTCGLVLNVDGNVKGYTDQSEASRTAAALTDRAKGLAAYRVVEVDAGPLGLRPRSWGLEVI